MRHRKFPLQDVFGNQRVGVLRKAFFTEITKITKMVNFTLTFITGKAKITFF